MPELTIETTIVDEVVIATTLTEGPALSIASVVNTIGGDPPGTAATLVADHEAAANPHPDYLTQAEGDALYGAGSVSSVNGESGPAVVLDADDVGAVPRTPITPILHTSAGGSLNTVLQAALDSAYAAGGGIVRLPAGGSFTLTDSLTIKETVELHAHGAKITYSGSGIMCLLRNLDGTGVTPGPRVLGGRWIGTSSAVGAFRILDSTSCHIESTKIEGFSNTTGDSGANTTGWAIEIRNEAHWSETSFILNNRVAGNRHAIVFTPQSVSGGVGGTDSFARTKVINLMVAGGFPFWPMIWMRGNVYDSVFYAIGGNIASNLVALFTFGPGGMNGTTIADLGIEGAGGSALFAIDPLGAPSQMPILTGSVHRDADQLDWLSTVGEFGGHTWFGARHLRERATDPLNPPTGLVSLYSKAEAVWFRASTGTAKKLAADADLQAHITDTIDAHDASAISTLVHGVNQEVEVQAGMDFLTDFHGGSGVTASRPLPASLNVGAAYFDTTLGIPVWTTGTDWVDATGAIV